MDHENLKLKEFLEVMQPASKSKTWVSDTVEDPPSGSPEKTQAKEVPDAESDEEYEEIPKKRRLKSPPKSDIPSVTAPLTPIETAVPDEEAFMSMAPNATDDDWLRGRTNRLLDLMNPEDMLTGTKVAISTDQDAIETAKQLPEKLEEAQMVAEVDEQEEHEMPDPILESIYSSGRLFVRNLPYTASEDDLRSHFEAFGAVEEVMTMAFLLFPHTFMMIIQIGTAYAYRQVM